MKIAFLIICLSCLLSGCVSTQGVMIQSDMNALNYKSCHVLAPNKTYTGVVLQADKVHVKAMNRNVLVALPTAIVDGFTGTDMSSVELQGIQYVVRVDGTRYTEDQLLTIVQGPESSLTVGDNVFIITTAETSSNSYSDSFSVRLAPVHNPKHYSKTGLRESFEQDDKGNSRVSNY